MLFYFVYNAKSFLADRRCADIVRELHRHRNEHGKQDVVTISSTVTPESSDAIILQLLSSFLDVCMIPHAKKAMKAEERMAFQCPGEPSSLQSAASLPKIQIRVIATNDAHLRLQAIHVFCNTPYEKECVLLVPIFQNPPPRAPSNGAISPGVGPRSGSKKLGSTSAQGSPGGGGKSRGPSRGTIFAPFDKREFSSNRLDEEMIRIIKSCGRVLFYPETDGRNTALLTAQPVRTLLKLARAQKLPLNKYLRADKLYKGSIDNHQIIRGESRLSTDNAVIFVDADQRIPLQAMSGLILPSDMCRTMGEIFDAIEEEYHTTSHIKFRVLGYNSK